MEARTRSHVKTRALLPLVIAAASLCVGPAEAAVCEAEPTDMPVDYGEQVTCGLSPATDTDLYRFSGVSGSRILAEVLFVSGSGFNPLLQLFAPDGVELRRFVGQADLILPQTGTYTVIVIENGQNNVGEYAFTVSCTAGPCVPTPPPPPSPPPGADIQCEQEPTDMFPHYGTRVTCDLTPATDTDLYRFVANAGDRILAEVLTVSGAGFNPLLQLIAPDGVELVRFDGRADLILPQTGTYTVIVIENGQNNVGEYAFTVSCTGGTCLPGISPNVILTLTGCTVCSAGEQFTVEAHWTNPSAVAVRVELKAGLRLPDGTAVNTLGNKHLEAALPAGLDVTANLLSFPWPTGLPAGTWTFEAALLGPNLGETFAREVKTFRGEP